MSKPDWMNFDDDDAVVDSAIAPLNSTDAFAATAIDSSSATDLFTERKGDHTNNKNNANDVPLFLRSDADDTASMRTPSSAGAASSCPAFLSGMPGQDGNAEEEGKQEDGKDSDNNNTRGDKKPLDEDVLRRPATADSTKGSSSSPVMYADQPSAALLSFSGDSGALWSLHRVRIIGKGNYGCASLYALDAALTADASSSTTFSAIIPVAWPSPRRAVVVKDINVQTMLNPQEDMAAVRNELRVLRGAVGHPNIVQYVDALFDSRPPSYPVCFIVMEYAAGGDLAALLERRGSAATSSPNATVVQDLTSSNSMMISEDHIAAFFIQTAVALHSLHTEYGILHRDVKPHNIFLLEDGVTVRLGDFGIAVQLGRIGEKAKEACGSPYFMAPEIFEEKPYDSAADVWSLGVVFYQLLTRQLPFTASSVSALGALVRRGQFVRLSEEGTTAGVAYYSKELRELVDSLLTVEPAARPTLRRVLRSRYVREHLRCVPTSVLQAKKPVIIRTPASPLSERDMSPTAAAPVVVMPQFTAESLYASVFGADAVADAVAHAVFPGVSPIVDRIARS